MRWSSLALLGILGGVGASSDPVQGPDLEAARRVFAEATSGARAQYDVTVLEAAKRLRGTLESALKEATESGDARRAAALAEELASVSGGALPVFGTKSGFVPGRWKIAYHPNGVRRTYVITAAGEVTCEEEDLAGRIERKGGALFVDFDDGKLERLTFAGTRLFVEHFNPRDGFPRPDQIGIGDAMIAR